MGQRVFKTLAGDLVQEIRSGYDVELIADLTQRGRKIPSDRLGLYDAAFAAVAESDPGQNGDHALCREAWRLFLSGVRPFQPYEQLDEDVLRPFEQEHVVTRRRGAYQFRHDLMRSYAAARWVMRHTSSMTERIARLEVDLLWTSDTVKAEDRREMLRFLVAMIERREDLVAFRKFAEEDMERRALLWALLKDKPVLTKNSIRDETGVDSGRGA